MKKCSYCGLWSNMVSESEKNGWYCHWMNMSVQLGKVIDLHKNCKFLIILSCYFISIIVCIFLSKDKNGKIVELEASCKKVTETEKPKAFIHWVSEPVLCEIRLYERLWVHVLIVHVIRNFIKIIHIVYNGSVQHKLSVHSNLLLK